MTHDFPIASAQVPCRVARVQLCAPALRGTGGAFVTAPDAQVSGTKTMELRWDDTRCRAFLAGADP